MIQSNVKAIMSEKKATYAKLERLTGISSQTITRARGARIRELSLEKLEVIAHALAVKVKDLFDEVNYEPKQAIPLSISKNSELPCDNTGQQHPLRRAHCPMPCWAACKSDPPEHK